MKRFVLAAVISFMGLLASALALAAVDINTANESQLETLPGIGPGKAKAIIAERQANGPFKSVDDLGRVKGIGDKTLAELRSQATVGSSPPAPSTSGSAPAGLESTAPGGGFPWGWVVVVVAAAGAIGWFSLRRRASPANSAGPSVPQQPSGATAPVFPKPAPASPPSGAVPKPAGPGSMGAPGTKAATSATSSSPPAPAGPKPAAHPAAVGATTTPPPAPAGPKRKDG